ncbi:hypothetical protein JCM3775_002546 [Rhodotorula graminis]
MDSNASSGTGAPSTRQGQREGSYHPMATDSDSDGGVSDGDPPDYSGGPRPALIAPRPSLGAVSVGGSGGSSGKKRSFDELEDIVFSNPKSFVALCNEIAASRNMSILIGDDRTHKVSSAYMHVLCAYRKAGCPFIIKLTKAKEGGWLIRGGEVDTKQRSTYRCRHPAGSKPDFKVGISTDEWMRSVDTRSSSHPNGGRPKAAKPRPVVPPLESPVPVQEESSAGRAPRMSSRTATRSSLAAPAPAPSPSTSGRLVGAPVTYAAIEPERALAPPFQRAIDLQAQIVPALSPRQGHHPHSAQSGMYSNGYSPRAHPGGPGGDPYRLMPSPSQPAPPHARVQSHHPQPPHPHHHPHSASHHHQGPPAPRPAPVDPVVLAEWTAVLTLIGDADLVPLSRVLASPYVSCTPASFFAESRAARLKLVDALPNESTGLWPKIKLGQRLAGDEGDKAWARMQGAGSAPVSRAASRSRSVEASRSVSVSASDASAAQVQARVLSAGSASSTAAKPEPSVGDAMLPPRAQPSGMFAAPARSSPPNGMDVDPVSATSPGLGAPVSAAQALSPAAAGRPAGLVVAGPLARQLQDEMQPAPALASALGISLANHLKASRGLYKALKPLADRYANLAGFRAYGLKYDDVLIEESASVQKAIGRLSEREAYDRAFRLRTASMCAIAHEELPKDKWIKPNEDTRYLKPFIKEVEAEEADRSAFDHATRA